MIVKIRFFFEKQNAYIRIQAKEIGKNRLKNNGLRIVKVYKRVKATSASVKAGSTVGVTRELLQSSILRLSFGEINFPQCNKVPDVFQKRFGIFKKRRELFQKLLGEYQGTSLSCRDKISFLSRQDEKGYRDWGRIFRGLRKNL